MASLTYTHSYGSSSCSTSNSAYTTTYNSDINTVVSVGSFPFRRWQISNANFAAGESYKIYNNTTNVLEFSIVGPFSGDIDSGCINFTGGSFRFEFSATSSSECDDNSDCPDGEKCLDGECVPCDEQQATHFQIRAEFEELVTLPDGSQTMYLLSSVYPIGSGVSNQIIQLAECNGVWYYPRIRFCDASGVIKPYTGALAFYGYCNPDGSTALWVNNFNAVEQSHFLGQRAQMDLHFSSPLSVARILVEFIEPSAVILEPDCSSVTPEDPPDIEPVEPDDPEEPDEPTEPDDPEEPDEPDKPTPPPQPQEGLCPCEEYIGLQIKRAADILYDGLILLKRELSVVGREIVVELWEKRKMDYQLSMFFKISNFSSCRLTISVFLRLGRCLNLFVTISKKV